MNFVDSPCFAGVRPLTAKPPTFPFVLDESFT